MSLEPEIEAILNALGPEGVKAVAEMGKTELLRNHCMQKFGWFRHQGQGYLGSDRRRCESAYMRYYYDHSRIPLKIDFSKVMDGSLTEDEVVEVMLEVYNAYLEQGIDLCSVNASEPADWRCIRLDI